MLKCKNLSKKLNGTLQCKITKSNISYQTCNKNCLNFILARNKGIKKVNAKRIFVQKEIYQKVYDRDKGKCRLADGTCEGKLELHHIKYRSERKDLINEPTNCIFLCLKHHKQVHSNKHYWQPKLIKMNKEIEKENK